MAPTRFQGGLVQIPYEKHLSSNNVELLLIDMDGTLGFSLIPEEQAISAAIKWISDEVTKLAGLPVSEEEVKQIYKQTKLKQYKLYPLQTRRHDKTLRFTLLLEDISRVKRIKIPRKMVEDAMKIYWQVFERNAAAYPGTHSTLEALKQRHRIVVITNNGKVEGEKKRRIFGLEPDKHYDLFITSDELGGTCKPSEAYFDRVLKRIKES